MEPGSRLAAAVLLCLLGLSLCGFSPQLLKPLLYEEQLLWVSGVEGQVSTYRIPLITFTAKGSLLAFSEARKSSERDLGAKFIAMRRSVDKGATWSPTSFIVNDGSHIDGVNLGAVVVDEEWGTVILIYALCFNHYYCYPSSTMMVESWDDGLSWSQPRNLSDQLGVKSFCPGPGFGIQKRYNPGKGRLVVCGHGTLEGNGVFCILSDDHGRTWYKGAALKSIPYNQKKKPQDFSPDECQPVELTNGSIVINARNQNYYHCRCRIVVRSDDGGQTLPLDTLLFDYELVDPAVSAGALLKDGVLYFTNPSNEQNRVNLTLRWSLNDGDSWEQKATQIWAGPSGYSSLTSLNSSCPDDEKYIFVIYEKGTKNYDETISFVKINLVGGR